MIRVLLAEDHETVRAGLKLLIDGQPDMVVVGEAGDGESALTQAPALQPDVTVLDVSMPRMNGLAAARALREILPKTAIVALTRYGDVAYVKALLEAGATGYVLKQSASSELLDAIRAAACGKTHIDADVARAAHPEERARPTTTPREAEVLRLMALGYSTKEIANSLELSVKTVEVHKANGMRKLGLAGRIDVIRYAVLQGWLTDA
jgi:DNA-binding NarL/FixJ family response regulator